MQSLLYVIHILLGFLEFMMMVYGVMSLLIFFRVLNAHGKIVGMIWYNITGIFEPLLAPIRRFVPAFRGFDWSFLILYLLIVFVHRLIFEYGFPAAAAINTGVM
jgi:YggT family protein